MLSLRCISFSPSYYCVRSISGYKISSERYLRKKIKANYSDEERFQESVQLAVLNRTKSKLRGFDKVTETDVMKRDEGDDPNAAFRDQEELSKYRSLWRYYKAAENERRRQKREHSTVWWKNLNYWLRQEQIQTPTKNIGVEILTTKDPRTMQILSKSDLNEVDLEKLARERKLLLDVDKIFEEWQNSRHGIWQTFQIAKHYNIFIDLFDDQEFHSVIPLEIEYPTNEDFFNPVYFGNELCASEIQTEPDVTYPSDTEKLYTLLLTSPDEHLEDNDKEYVHWLIGNIPGNEVSQGELLVNYMQPIPARGTGYHRNIFILFEQTDRVDFDSEKRIMPCVCLRQRNFKTSQFYGKYSEQLTPVSFRFFQCKWDYSVQKMFQETLLMPEPVYEYEKVSEEPQLSALRRHNQDKTLHWLSHFMPKEIVYPDGSSEWQNIRIEAAVRASAVKERANRKAYPVQNVY